MFGRQGLKIALLTMTIYVLLLIPFKQFVIVDTLTEIRPAGAIPVVMAVLFGPGAALGAAFGNLIGDTLGGTLTLGSIPGFIGNFALSFVAWGVWTLLISGKAPSVGLRTIVAFLTAGIAASIACALIIAAGLDLLGLAPFALLFGIIALNDIVWSCTFGLFLVLFYSRLQRRSAASPA
jgi:energy-coupling factor transport system substrate-specific component